MLTSSEDEIVQEPSMAKNSSPSRAPKTGAQLRDNRRSAKNDAKCVEKAPSPPPSRHCKEIEYHSLLHNWTVHDSGDELNLPLYNGRCMIT